MKSTPLIVNWHDQNAPIYSAHFGPHGKGRLATSGGDNNVRVRLLRLPSPRLSSTSPIPLPALQLQLTARRLPRSGV